MTTCPDRICDNSSVVVLVETNGEGSFTFTEYVEEGTLVEKGATEHTYSSQRSNTGTKKRVSGNSYITMPLTLNLFPNDTETQNFFRAYARNPMAFVCCNITVNDPCEDILRLGEAELENIDLSDITNDDTQTSISFTNGRVLQ